MKSKFSSKEAIERLKRTKYSSPESKFEWLQSAFEFAKAKKRIKK